jgi:hypothetical protein
MSILALLADTAAGRERDDVASCLASFPGGTGSLAAWLIRNDLAPLGRAAATERVPALVSALERPAMGAAAANLAHFATLERVERMFEAERIPLLLLKGAAVSRAMYADDALRPMTDLDAWIPESEMHRAVAALRELGFRQDAGLPTRPEALQRLSGGELVFRPSRGGHGLIELHFSPFQGWWIKRTAVPDLPRMWDRAVPAGPGRYALRLADEDAVIQTALHLAVSQFGQAPLRGLMDLAVTARVRGLDWSLVSSRARSWRLARAVWLVLDIADRLIGLPGSRESILALRPRTTVRALLHAFASPESILGARDLTPAALRHPFMLALADRPRDAARLLARGVWPEPWWIEARHGASAGRLTHVAHVLRRGHV